MSGAASKSALFARLPSVPKQNYRAEIRALAAGRKLAVLDDDPTGTQTVYDVPVLTGWSQADLAAELRGKSPCFYILTNSRSMTETQARSVNTEIARNLRGAACGEFTLVSRCDSTLRGHFPLETDALAAETGPFDATVLMPYFEAGGRFTIDDIHYVAEGDRLVPASETPFAKDAAFGYWSSNLREHIAEKTRGRISPSQVRSIGIAELRAKTPEQVARTLRELPPGAFVIVNACHPSDAEVFALATLLAENLGARLMFRTAAQFVAARLGIEPRAMWRPPGPCPPGLIVVGSHVPKTTSQLAALLGAPSVQAIEISVAALLDCTGREDALAEAAARADAAMEQGRTPVLFTSREFVAGQEDSLETRQSISRGLVDLVRRIRARPGFVLAKGGITSSDIATKALRVRRAIVLGQILPGVPVWELGPETVLPGVPYIVFPGNVGCENDLARALGIMLEG